MADKVGKPNTQDLRNIAKRVHSACVGLEYLSPAAFRAFLEVAVAGYNQGLGIKYDKGQAETMEHLVRYAMKGRCEAAAWVKEWIKKSGLDVEPLPPSGKHPFRHPIARIFGTSGTYPLGDFGVMFASPKKPHLLLLSWSGYVLPFDDVDEGISFAALFWDALKQAEDDQLIVNPPQIPEDYASEALQEWQDQMRIDAWNNVDDQSTR